MIEEKAKQVDEIYKYFTLKAKGFETNLEPQNPQNPGEDVDMEADGDNKLQKREKKLFYKRRVRSFSERENEYVKVRKKGQDTGKGSNVDNNNIEYRGDDIDIEAEFESTLRHKFAIFRSMIMQKLHEKNPAIKFNKEECKRIAAYG